MLNKKTSELDFMLSCIENEEELKKYFNQTLSRPILTFVDYVESLRLSKNLKKSVLIDQSDLHRTYGYQILNGTKSPSRDNIIKLCLGGHFSLDETNRALTLGGYNKLYAKDPRDSLITFCLQKQQTVIETNLFLDHYNFVLLGENNA